MQALKFKDIDYLDQLHSNSIGWITKSNIKNNKYSQYHYKYADLKKLDLTLENTFISLNTFYKPSRRIENIKELKALFLDLDTYKTKFTKQQIIFNLEKDYYKQSIPTPNYLIDSGRGLYLVWLINSLPSQALPLWRATEEYLYKQLKQFGADRQALDCTRVLRVPNSINSKSKTTVKVLDYNSYVYDLKEIKEEYLPTLEPTNKKKKGRPNKINFVFRERSLYYARIQDIIKICELRNYNLSGHRELILFLYRYYLCSFTEDTEKALSDTLELNQEFIRPLQSKEVIKATESAEKCYKSKDKQYKYKNNTLIELLEITEEEQKHLKTIISKQEYKRRENIRRQKNYKKELENKGKVSKKQEIEERRIKIKDLVAKGLKRIDICSILNISIRIYKNDVKHLKDQGLL